MKEFEKRTLRDELGKAQGSALDKAKQAVTKVINATPDYIDMKSSILEDVSHLMEQIGQMAEDGDPD